MQRTFLFAMLACGIGAANPVMEAYFSEIQAAPDSLERVELHPYTVYRPLPVDIYGWTLVTDAGVCTVQTHIVLDSATFAVLDRSNLGPGFSLGDETDSLVLLDEHGAYVTAIGYPLRRTQNCLAPPPGHSAAIYHNWIWQYPDPIEVIRWYVDATPTLGARNDDTVGGIRGRILDDRGLPVGSAMVSAIGPGGWLTGWADSLGRYEFHPTGPGTFWLTASRPGHNVGSYPDSVAVGSNEWRDSIDIVIARTGIIEDPAARLQAPAVRQQGRSLVVAGSGAVTVLDLTGRSVLSSLSIGSSVLDLGVLRPGVYFVRLVNGGSTLSRKLVLH